jgi:hypothetical protein
MVLQPDKDQEFAVEFKDDARLGTITVPRWAARALDRLSP